MIARRDRDRLRQALEVIEGQSGKGQVKWNRAKHGARLAYLRSALKIPLLKGKLLYDTFPNTRNYADLGDLDPEVTQLDAKPVVLRAAEGPLAELLEDAIRDGVVRPPRPQKNPRG